jgi:LysM repeat protein
MSIRTSESIVEISKALAKAQGKFSAAVKGSQNPAFRSKYADLSSVIDATLEHLNAEGITCMQHPSLEYKPVGEGVEAYITVTTRLLHASGEWIESDLSIPAVQRDRFDAQSCGSALTYACRYALQSICVVPREDDDGNAATGRGSSEDAKAVAQRKIAQSGKTPTQGTKVDTLFYVIPSGQGQNGIEYAEFLNIPPYMASNQDRVDELRYAFSAVGAKKPKDEGAPVKVNREKLNDLLSVLAGDLGIKVEQLQAAKEH